MRRWSTNSPCPTMPNRRRCFMLDTPSAISLEHGGRYRRRGLVRPHQRAGGRRGGAGAHPRARSDPQFLHRGHRAARAACARRRSTTPARAASRSVRSPACRSRSKNLFDIAGLPTLAGSKINRDDPPAKRDAALIERLEAAGAILVGALNMGEYAYDFTGENIHDGPSRNPHDLDRMTGGSSGGSGGAVGGGLVPLALGSDTNGSIRVPSSLCGTVRTEADLRPADPRAHLSLRREPRSSRPVGAHRARSRARL